MILAMRHIQAGIGFGGAGGTVPVLQRLGAEVVTGPAVLLGKTVHHKNGVFFGFVRHDARHSICKKNKQNFQIFSVTRATLHTDQLSRYITLN